MVNICTSYLLKGVLRQQVVQQVDVLQPQRSHVQIAAMFLQGTVKMKEEQKIEKWICPADFGDILLTFYQQAFRRLLSL